MDVGEFSQLDGFVESVGGVLEDVWGREDFDYLVNNAGMQVKTSLGSVEEADFDSLVNVHFKGVFFLTQKIADRIVDGGAIVNLSSGLARHTAPQRIIYGPIKAGVEVLTRYMAQELGPRGIRANAVRVGATATDFSGGRLRDSVEFQEHTVSITALGRYATADDIGPVIAALLSDANRWVTGEVIEASGGAAL